MVKKKIRFIVLIALLVLFLALTIFVYINRYEIHSWSCFPEPNKCIIRFAVEENDLSICEHAERLQGKAACYEQVAISRTDESLCESQILNHVDNTFFKDNCYWEIANKKGNELLCGKMINYSASCYKDIALIKNDISICKLSRSQKEIGICYYKVIQQSEKYELSSCLGLPEGESRKECYGG